MHLVVASIYELALPHGVTDHRCAPPGVLTICAPLSSGSMTMP